MNRPTSPVRKLTWIGAPSLSERLPSLLMLWILNDTRLGGDFLQHRHEVPLHGLEVLRHWEMAEARHRNEFCTLDLRHQLLALLYPGAGIVLAIHDIDGTARGIDQMCRLSQVMLNTVII